VEYFSTLKARHLGDLRQFYDGDHTIAAIIELMTQENTIIDDVPFLEASHPDKNKTVLRRSLPEIYWRRLYKGVPISKSTVDTVDDPMGMMEARSMVDAKLEEIHGSKFASYRMLESKTFLEAMKQEAATAILYGNIKNNPEMIHGLAPRYAYKNGPNVIDAGGTGNKLTSIYLVVWGPNTAHGIYPKDSKAGLSHKPLAEADYPDDAGNYFRAVGDIFSWNLGLSVRDWRCVVRICNIDVEALQDAKDGDADYVDLARLLIKAKNKLPAEKKSSAKVYMNSDVMTALELQAMDRRNVQLSYGEAFNSKNVPFIHSLPVRQVDSLLSTEEALPAAPAV
jgi:hypothetical protein